MSSVKRLLVLSQWTLFGIALVTVGWCLFVIGESLVVQREGRRVLEARPVVDSPTSDRSRESKVARGAPLAQLLIPRIGLSAVVLEGDDNRTLRLGPGHIVGTPMPGQPGNVAIAGHRDTFFRPLRNVRVGDEITLVAARGRFEYRVSSLRVVTPDQVSVLDPTDHSILTLVTCFPFSMLGHAPDRFIVRATLVGGGTTEIGAQGRRTARPNVGT